MKHVVRRAFWDYENEEAWLNEMSARGLALSDYSWCRYVFEETPNSEYIYRIELLENLPSHPKSMNYIRFLEENGVECVSTYFRWIFLRKKASAGEFEIYTDIDSKINHFKRVNSLWNVLTVIEFIAGFMNLFTGLISFGYKVQNGMTNWNLIMGVLLTVLGILFLRLGAKMRKKIKKLKLEKTIHE